MNESSFVIEAGEAMLEFTRRGEYYPARANAWEIVGRGRLMALRDGCSTLTDAARLYVELADMIKQMDDRQLARVRARLLRGDDPQTILLDWMARG